MVLFDRLWYGVVQISTFLYAVRFSTVFYMEPTLGSKSWYIYNSSNFSKTHLNLGFGHVEMIRHNWAKIGQHVGVATPWATVGVWVRKVSPGS